MKRQAKIAGFLVLAFGLAYSLIGLDPSGFGVAAVGPFSGFIVHGYAPRICSCGEGFVNLFVPIMVGVFLTQFLIPRSGIAGRIRTGIWIAGWVTWCLSGAAAAANASS